MRRGNFHPSAHLQLNGRHTLRDKLSRYSSPSLYPQALTDALMASLSGFPRPTGEDLTIPVTDYFPDIGKKVKQVILPFYAEEAAGAYQTLRKQLHRNLKAVKHVMPPDYKGDDPVFTYLHDTPLLQLFEARVPFGIPENARFKGQWIVAPQGTGKTQFIQYQISKVIPAVLADHASIIVQPGGDDTNPLAH